MFVLWTGAHGAPPLPETAFLGLVVGLSPYSIDTKASRLFSVFVRTYTTQDTKIIPIFEHHLVPYSKNQARLFPHDLAKQIEHR